MTSRPEAFRQDSLAEELFDCLPDVVFFTKDASGRYLSVNTTFVVRSGLESKAELIGRYPSQVLGPKLGKSYERQDRSVIRTGLPIEKRLELHVYPNRRVGWCLTSKFPVFEAAGKIGGVAGISQDLRTPDMPDGDYAELAEVIDYVRSHLSLPPSVADLAAITGLSPYRLDRRIRQAFGLTTGQWVLKQRLDLAQQQLRDTQSAIAEIAQNAGYSDQSTFTRQFRLATGFSPRAFRLFSNKQ